MRSSSSNDRNAGAVDTATVTPTEYRFRKFRFEVTRGPDQGKAFVSEASELSIGSAAGNSFVLTDPTVSRHHCAVSATPLGFLLQDLGSKNGTRLGTHRVVQAYLKAGSTISVGETVLRFDHLDEESAESLSANRAYGPVLGDSVAIRRIFALLQQVSSSSLPILIEGETGTGKTLLAEAIHAASSRAAGPFVIVDCGSIVGNLIESELFGHVKGAFTGAHTSRIGAFEAAHGGTLFLDEIGELPLDLQPKLLRALEDHKIRRIGSHEPVELDVRVIAATNRDLRSMLNDGWFRSDLFFRLNNIRLRLPPLRERPEDIVLLANHFYGQATDDADAKLPPETLERIVSRRWPGNVRELRSAIERMVLLGDRALADDDQDRERSDNDEPDVEVDVTVPFRIGKEQLLERWERAYLQQLLASHGGNLTHAARAARIDRNYLRELVHKRNIKLKDEPDPQSPSPSTRVRTRERRRSGQ